MRLLRQRRRSRGLVADWLAGRELAAVGGEPALEDLLRADDLAAGRQIGLIGATLVNRAWQVFREQHVTAWPVVDDDGRYLGMVRQERILTQHQAGMSSRPGSGPLAVVVGQDPVSR